MSNSFSYPFPCEECQTHTPNEFVVYEPTNDWLIAIPEKNLLHIHFGESTFSAKQNIEEAQFHWKWLQSISKKFPNEKFFFVIDLSRKDDGEFLVDEAKQIYKKIRQHPQLAAAAVYGQTPAMKMIVNMFLFMGGVKTTLVDNRQQATSLYKKWFAKKNSTA